MILVAIWPLFALICLGFVLSRRGWPDPVLWPMADRLNYWILFPALLVSNLAAAPLSDPAIPRLGGAIAVTILIAATALFALRRLRPMPAARFGPAVQGVVRFNTYLGLATVVVLGGDAALGPAAILLAVAVPLVNVIAVIALSPGRGPLALARPLVTNPLILACLAGIALSATGLGLPYGTDRFIGLLAQASLPLGLLCVGAALRPSALRGDLAPIAAVSAIRLILMPILAFAVAFAFGLGATEIQLIVVFAAIPTAPTAYALTRQLGGDATYMAGLVTAQTVLSLLTIPAMLGLISP